MEAYTLRGLNEFNDRYDKDGATSFNYSEISHFSEKLIKKLTEHGVLIQLNKDQFTTEYIVQKEAGNTLLNQEYDRDGTISFSSEQVGSPEEIERLLKSGYLVRLSEDWFTTEYIVREEAKRTEFRVTRGEVLEQIRLAHNTSPVAAPTETIKTHHQVISLIKQEYDQVGGVAFSRSALQPPLFDSDIQGMVINNELIQLSADWFTIPHIVKEEAKHANISYSESLNLIRDTAMTHAPVAAPAGQDISIEAPTNNHKEYQSGFEDGWRAALNYLRVRMEIPSN